MSRYWRSTPSSEPAAPARDTPEKRRHGRVRTGAVVCSLGEVVDLSASGLRVRCQGRPPCVVGQRITVTIGGSDGPFSVALRPVWMRKVGMFKHELGACFEEVSEETRVQLLNLVRSAVTVLPVGPDHNDR